VSVRALAFLAGALGLLVVAGALLAARRAGLIGSSAPPPPLRFVNTLLDAQPRDEYYLVPQDVTQPTQRCLVDHAVLDPDPVTDPALPYGGPHLVVAAGLNDPRDPGAGFAIHKIGALPLDRLGSISEGEWFERARVVREARPDGTERDVVALEFGRSQGGTSIYFHDPKAPVRPVGWFRLEVQTPSGPTEIYFARTAN